MTERSSRDTSAAVSLSTPGWRVQQDVKDALFYDPATDAYEVDVEVKDGIATLTGVVDSFAEYDLAETVAKGVRGLRGVENQIRVNYRTERPAREVLAEVKKRLRWDALVDGTGVEVLVPTGDDVRLEGVVGSAAERRRAIMDARVAGVKTVDASKLRVQPNA